MKRAPARFEAGRLILCAALCMVLLAGCEQKRDWRGVWSDIAPAGKAQNVAAIEPVALQPSPAEVLAAAAPFLLSLTTPDGRENPGRGVLLRPASSVAMVYVGDYKGESASAVIAGKSYKTRLFGFDTQTGFALAKIEAAFSAAVLPAGTAEIAQGAKLLIIAASGGPTPVTVETRAAQAGTASAADTPFFTTFPAARNLAGGLVFDRSGGLAGVAYIPQGSDLMAVQSADYLLGRCAAWADMPPVPAAIECPKAAPCPQTVQLADNTQESPAAAQVPAWFGAGIIELNPAWAKKNGISREKGLYIKEVRPASPFEAAGIKRGDLLLELGGKAVENRQQLAEAMQAARPGSVTPVKVMAADGRELTLAIIPALKAEP